MTNPKLLQPWFKMISPQVQYFNSKMRFFFKRCDSILGHTVLPVIYFFFFVKANKPPGHFPSNLMADSNGLFRCGNWGHKRHCSNVFAVLFFLLRFFCHPLWVPYDVGTSSRSNKIIIAVSSHGQRLQASFNDRHGYQYVDVWPQKGIKVTFFPQV